MERKLYGIKDDKVGAFSGKLFEARNDQEAARMLHAAVNDNQVQLSVYPEDFSLWYIASYDDASGIMMDQGKSSPRFVVGAIALKNIAEKEPKNAKEVQ